LDESIRKSYIILLNTILMLHKFKVIFKMVKIEHTLFAMPFLYSGAILASGGIPSLWVLFWITLGLFSARSAAMSLNRLIDRNIDALNPRTRERALVTGALTPSEVKVIIVISLLVLLLCAAMLNTFTLELYPLAVAIMWLYPYTKRFTWLSHVALGFALGIAPAGAWAAVKASLNIPAILLALSVVAWVAGFDIIYALQDIEFDRKHRLFSIPAIFGVKKSLIISSFFHSLMFIFLLALYFVTSLGGIYLFGLAVIAFLLFYEHKLISPENISQAGVAFFNINAVISFVLFFAIALDIFL